MRQLPADKYNVAWFKLAEFVARGERERALGLYKLLVHSFDSLALAHQLEGDLLLSFNDTKQACQKYEQAIELYKSQHKIIEAAALYEHLILLEPLNSDYLIQIMHLYDQLEQDARLLVHLEQLCRHLIEQKEYEQLNFYSAQWEPKIYCNKGELYKTITVLLIKKNALSTVVKYYLKKTMECLIINNNSSVLQTFLSTIETLHYDYYHEATLQLQEL